MLHIARVAMLNSNQLKKTDTSKAIAELDKARDNLNESIRFVSFCHKFYAKEFVTIQMKVMMR